jgi:Dockerin type I repeat.
MAYIEMLPHAYQNTVVPPTCTTDGYTLKKCSVCGAEEQTDTVAALGHKYVKGICERCGEKDPDAPDAKKGDLDNDGEITSADAVLLMRSLATLAELTDEQHTAADLDGDGYITSADAVMMARYLAGLVYSFD